MSRLIDADLAPLYLNGEGCKMIKRMPTVDAVEVVRCGECVYSRPLNRHDRLENQFYEGCVWCMEHSEGNSERYYCADGKRRDDNG